MHDPRYAREIRMYSIEGQLAWDGVIELTSLSIDTEGLIDPEEPADDA